MIADRIEISLARQLNDEQFVTAVLAEVSADGSKIKLLSCGHPPPLLIAGRDRPVRRADRAEPAAGPGPPGRVPRDVTTVPFAPDDQMLFYTDGVSEARNRAGEFYPLPRPGAHRRPGPGGVLDRLQQDVLRHVGHALDDDAAMLLLRREPALTHPGRGGGAMARRGQPARSSSPPGCTT